MSDRFTLPTFPIDPAGWYSVGREDTTAPFRVVERIVAYGPFASDADLAHALDRVAPRASAHPATCRSAQGSEILAGAVSP